jgi:hypothetical protein
MYWLQVDSRGKGPAFYRLFVVVVVLVKILNFKQDCLEIYEICSTSCNHRKSGQWVEKRVFTYRMFNLWKTQMRSVVYLFKNQNGVEDAWEMAGMFAEPI